MGEIHEKRNSAKVCRAMRDSKIELFRCACMFGVVLLHSLTQGGYADAHRGLDNLMTPSVVGFVFISGYFGIKCRLKGVLKILGIGLSSWLVLALLNLDFTSSFGIGGFWWFLWMYLALMAMAPLVEAIFAGNCRDAVVAKVAPFVAVVYVWSYAATKIPVLKTVVPSVDGFSPFGVLTFFAVYLVARVSRMYEERIKTWWLVVAAAVSGAMCWMGFYHYNSPFALVFAGSMFYLVKGRRVECVDGERIGRVEGEREEGFSRVGRDVERGAGLNRVERVETCRGRWLLAISPSMFSVYLLHTNAYGFKILREVEDNLVAAGWNYYAMAFVVAFGIFVICVMLDMPRRAISWIIARKRLADSR